MFDIGMSELLLIAIVALIVVGPKDLPKLFHTLGRFTAKMRALGREFTSAMNAAARESGVDDVAKGLKGVANPKKFGLDKLSDAADRFEKWDPNKPDAAPKPARAGMDPDRAADIEKIRAATEKAGQAKLDREAKAKAKAGEPAAGDAPVKPAAQGPRTKKAARKPTAARGAAVNKTTAKRTTSKTTAAPKATVKSGGTKASKSRPAPAAASKADDA